jgi:hypothetical protein
MRGLRHERGRCRFGRRVVARPPASEVAFLQGLDQAAEASPLPVGAAPVHLARQVRVVCRAGPGAPFREQRKPRGVARLTDGSGKPCLSPGNLAQTDVMTYDQLSPDTEKKGIRTERECGK